MAKGQQNNKESKKKPAMSLKDKRAAKRAKKDPSKLAKPLMG